MSDLKRRLQERSAGLVRREPVPLPETGETVQVRGMMFGEKERVAGAPSEKQGYLMIALCTEDPETSKLIYNANAQEDHDLIAALPVADTEAIVDAVRRLSGLDGAGKGSPVTGSSPSPSPESSAAPSTSSASE